MDLLDLIGETEFGPVDEPIGDARTWMQEFGAVRFVDEDIDLESHLGGERLNPVTPEGKRIRLVWSVAPTGELRAGKGGWIRCHLSDPRVEAVRNEDIPTYIKMAR